MPSFPPTPAATVDDDGGGGGADDDDDDTHQDPSGLLGLAAVQLPPSPIIFMARYRGRSPPLTWCNFRCQPLVN